LILALHIIFMFKETSLGLSWREENELKKALYASLHNKRHCIAKQPCSDSETTPDTPGGSGGNISSGNNYSHLCI